MCLENLKSRSDLSLNEIIQLMDVETDLKIYKKLFYFKFKAMGFSIIESYGLASIKRSTAYNLEDQWNDGEYNALLPKGGHGRKPKLNEDQIKELELILKTKDSWLINDVLKLIKEKWNIKYSYHGVQNLLESYFNVNIDNYYHAKQESKKYLDNFVQNFDNISNDEKNQIEVIIKYIREEKEFNVLNKLFYLLFKKLGFSTDVSSYFLSVTPVTGNNWLKRWKKEKYEGLLHKKGQGRKPKLNKENTKKLKKT
jgi:transposase